MIEKNNKQNKTLLVFDYDDTIAFGTDKMSYKVINQFLGNDEAEKMVKKQNYLGGIVEDFIINYPYNKKEVIGFLQHFVKESDLYKKLKESKIEEVQDTLKKIEKLVTKPKFNLKYIAKASKSFRRYFMEEIVAKIAAYNNIYVHKLVPQEAFFDIVEKTIAQPDNFELVINTFKHKVFIETELNTLNKFYKSQNQEQKIGIINFLLKNNKVFGTNNKYSKGQENTIECIIKKTKNTGKINNIYIFGDGMADEKSYNNIKKLPEYENKNINFFLINGVLLKNILKEKTDQLQQNTTKLKVLENKLTEQKRKLEKDKNIKIFENLEKALIYMVENNIIKGQTKNIVQLQ